MESKNWTTIIKPDSSWLSLNLNELWRYRDLLLMFVRRDFISVYKQTILGPLWFVIQPLLTTIMFIVVFDQVAGIPTDGAPPALFYLSGLLIWNYFSSCLIKTANTFNHNVEIFGKVYFPRLIIPLSTLVSSLVSFGIQLLLFFGMILYFHLVYSMAIEFNHYLVAIPFLLILVALLALGAGIIISSLTNKYKDLTFLLNFGVQLLMYATPVIYPLSFFESKYRNLIIANPLTHIVEIFRYALLGVGEFNIIYISYSIFFTLLTLSLGILVFNKVEKNFMDII